MTLEGGMDLNCVSCGAVNPEGKRYCSMCGEMLGASSEAATPRTPLDDVQSPPVHYVQARQNVAIRSREDLMCGLLGGVAWLLVSLGTFIVAFGWLGVLDASYYNDPQGSLRMIGYGVIVYGVAAILFSVRAFEKGIQ